MVVVGILGVLVGVVLAVFGGGGSVLAVPALVHLLGRSAQEATTITLAVVGVASAVGLAAHAGADRVRWRTGGALAAAGVLGAAGGSALSSVVAGELLLLAFAPVMAAAAVMMWRGEAAPAGVGGYRRTGLAVRAGAAGLGTGFVTGFFGIGGGFVIVPVLVLLFGVSTPVAVATSLLVITVNAAGGLAVRLAATALDWSIVVPFVAAAAPAALLGERIVGSVDARHLTRGFALGLAAVALYTGTDAALAL